MQSGQYMRLLRRNWVQFAVAVVLAMIAAALLYANATPSYQSSVSFTVQSNARSSDPSQIYQAELLSQARTQTYLHLVSGPGLVERLQRSLDLPIAQLQGHLAATSAPGSVLLTVAVTDQTSSGTSALSRALTTELPGYVQDLQVDDAQPVTSLRVVAAPSPPRRVAPLRTHYAGLGLLGGLLGGLLLGVIRETRDHRVRDASDVRSVVGQAPVVVDLSRRWRSRSWKADASTLIPLATVLTVASTTRRPLALVPLAPGSRSAWQMLHLGWQLTRTGEHVALVDADLEGQWVSGLATSRAAKGLVDLRDDDPFRRPVNDSESFLLQVVPAKVLKATLPGQIGLSLAKLSGLLRDGTDIVLVATSSVLLRGWLAIPSDAPVDAVLLVERAKSSKQELRVAVDVLRELHTSVAAVVLFSGKARAQPR
jgi:capsular polysaccharide biosynthesis protein